MEVKLQSLAHGAEIKSIIAKVKRGITAMNHCVVVWTNQRPCSRGRLRRLGSAIGDGERGTHPSRISTGIPEANLTLPLVKVYQLLSDLSIASGRLSVEVFTPCFSDPSLLGSDQGLYHFRVAKKQRGFKLLLRQNLSTRFERQMPSGSGQNRVINCADACQDFHPQRCGHLENRNSKEGRGGSRAGQE